jgi:tRNA threonylcarbamoyl adenosine modification protein YjeE
MAAIDVEPNAVSHEELLHDLADTDALGARIAAALRRGDAVALEGDLGAGKTALARAILRALGHEGAVPSPTFTLVQRYDTPGLVVSHFDLYRLRDASELEELGWDDAAAEGAILVEWPEKAASRLPADALIVRLAVADGGSRSVRISGDRKWAALFQDGKP